MLLRFAVCVERRVEHRCPLCFEIIEQQMDREWGNPYFSTAVFRFLAEISLNRSSRINGDDPSPRIALFFRFVASVAQKYFLLAASMYESSPNVRSLSLCISSRTLLILIPA